ncbi:DUF4143 domain-containing protein [Bacteroidales bacterium OttesenSCG-928-K03]|nr:DUF4143 domain-containing protein [Odoribacter sp. OttesenSCG-928-L07]MDL2238636.1 DUF4143 domain-containing protein [Bacteroidales bacterium OttesenSCG-928-L14]MDL2240271.1 DUF4143 domain-containing protein [Bacteroidales bacterium OttesenSCG-928-K22]MDL2242712.1 DUF4143 domain-containing protein [Bacteroidales bacterium OttesenSCG-928-K03]
MQEKYIKRQLDNELIRWKNDDSRKPLLLRGARQVGKSSSVRYFSNQFEYFVEINFEMEKKVHEFFVDDLSPQKIIDKLSILYDIPIIPGKTLLFFDEIQACLPAISSLRFFYEKMPELHLVAAGSLLEFALTELPSFGVGRIRSLFVYPLSFNEFLDASGENTLKKEMQKASPKHPLDNIFHEKLLTYLRLFLVLGGMPEVVAEYIKTKDIKRTQQILDDLVISLKDDFVKYKAKVPSLRINEIFDSVIQQSGGKFMYSKASLTSNHLQIKEALELLIMAGLVIPVTHTSANGLPLGAEANPTKRKMLLFDTGILQRLSGLPLSDIILGNDFKSINKGHLAEQFVGLELLKSSSHFARNELYYWHREAKSSNAEVDYLIQHGEQIIPIEVKSSNQGSMQSMYLFLNEKHLDFGIRTSLENFSEYNQIKVYPLYAISKLEE